MRIILILVFTAVFLTFGVHPTYAAGAVQDGGVKTRTIEISFTSYDGYEMFGKLTIPFILNAQGKVDEMKIDVPNPDFDFKELVFQRMR